MIRGGPKTGEALVEATVDVDIPEFPALEAGFIVTWVVMDKRCVIVTAYPPDFGMGDSNLLFLGQGR